MLSNSRFIQDSVGGHMQECHPSTVFRINNKLDPKLLSAVLIKKRRLNIPSILGEQAAEQMYHHLSNEVSWDLELKADRWARSITSQQAKDLDISQKLQMYQLAYSFRSGEHAHLYKSSRVSDNVTERALDVSMLARFAEYLNSQEFLQFSRQLIGIADLCRVDVRAMRYSSGDFISSHTDRDAAGTRRAAYVFTFSPTWQAEWGGLLEFLAADGEVEEAYVPRFNSLTVFLVPQYHSVSFVTPFAGGERYSVSGWMHSRGE